MFVSVIMMSFCLLLSFCITEILLIHKLMNRLKWFRKYVLEFIAIQDSAGKSLESYMFKKLIPIYMSSLIGLAIFELSCFLFIPNIKVKLGALGLGLLSILFIRFYNSKFIRLIWEKVLPPIS